MTSLPFRFLDSPAAVRKLQNTLYQIGLSAQEKTPGVSEEDTEREPYQPAMLRFTCPWLREPIEIRWHFHWWPDGDQQEDDRIVILRGASIHSQIDIGALLGKPLAKALDEIIIEQIATRCAELTGKRLPRRK